jgi:hypothetical protein
MRLAAASACFAVVVLSAAGFAAAPRPAEQDTLRVVGQILAEGGGPLSGARIKTDAIRGPMGAPFGARREFRDRTDASGDWALLGLTRGLWVFEVSALDYLPHVIVVPISMMLKPEPVPWETSLALLPISAIAPDAAPRSAPERLIVLAAERAEAGESRAARDALKRLEGTSLDAGALCAAGDIALLIREPAMSRRFFELAASAAATWYRPQLGIASAAMLTFDVDRAIKAFAAARSNTENKRLQIMLSAVVRDLQQIRSLRTP